MTARTRYFFVGSALILVLGLGIGTVAYYGGMPSGLFAAAAGPDELRYVPSDAAVVAYANVKDVMHSELRQRLVTLEGEGKQHGRDEFKNETGIDIEQDIDHVVACVVKGGGEPDTNSLMVARGRFDRHRIEALAREHGGQVEPYKGKQLVTALGKKGDADRPRTRMAMSFVEPGLVVMGSDEMVRQAIDAASGAAANITTNEEMMKRVADIRNESMWAVGHFESIAAQAKLPNEVSGRIPPITWFAASGHVNGGMQATLKAETQTEEAANNLRDLVRGFTALAKMSTGNNPEMQALWPEIELGGTGTTVTVSFAVSSALLDAVTKAGEMQRKVIRQKKTDKAVE
jgi:hypothetical protein